MTAHEVGGEFFAVKNGCYTVAELAAWMGASPAFVYNAVLNGEIAKSEGGRLLIPFNFVEIMYGGNKMKILTEKELATHLHLSPWTIRKWRLQGGLPHLQVGRRVFYRLQAVEDWMCDMERASKGPKGPTSLVSVA